MVAVLNLKRAREKCLPLTGNPDKNEFKVNDLVLLKNHASTSAFDT